MTSDIRAAAEKLREHGMGAIDRPRWVAKAVMKVVDAYLADHPADTDDPVTAEFLQSLGFSYSEHSGLARILSNCLRFIEMYRDGSLCGLVSDNDEPSIDLPNQKTRGDVRRLLAALGGTQGSDLEPCKSGKRCRRKSLG